MSANMEVVLRKVAGVLRDKLFNYILTGLVVLPFFRIVISKQERKRKHE